MTRPLTAADFNMLFRGTTYGAHDIFTPRSFAEFVAHHQIDLERAVIRHEGGKLLGALAFGIREDRAWFALIGVREDQRRSGVGKALVAEAIARVRAAGVRTIELETVQRNAAAANMMLERGFSIASELVVWTRSARKRAQAPPPPQLFTRADVERIARVEAACWQREPRSVAAVRRLSLIEVPGAYAFLRVRDGYGMLLDAGASDDAAAGALAHELDARVPCDVTLNNEPASSPLSRILVEHGWRAIERQHRLITQLSS